MFMKYGNIEQIILSIAYEKIESYEKNGSEKCS